MPWSDSARKAALEARRNRTAEGKVVTKPVVKKETQKKAKPQSAAPSKPEDVVIEEVVSEEIVLLLDDEEDAPAEDIDFDALLGDK